MHMTSYLALFRLFPSSGHGFFVKFYPTGGTTHAKKGITCAASRSYFRSTSNIAKKYRTACDICSVYQFKRIKKIHHCPAEL
jgi:hypothetical protein